MLTISIIILSLRQNIELFHLLFLEQLALKMDKKLYCVKEGCNLRFYLKSIRYSEDLDIDIQTISKDSLQNKISTLLHGPPFQQVLAARGLVITHISHAKQTQARDIFDLHHLLFYVEKPKLSQDNLARLDEAKINALSVSFHDFKSQVLAYLLPEHQPLYNDQTIWNSIILKIIAELDKICD